MNFSKFCLSYSAVFDQVPVTGFKTPFRDGYVRHLAEEVLTLAKVSASLCYYFLCSCFSFLKKGQVHRTVVCKY
jgi:hypothetical protein